ncbi:DNA repair exonuclease [Paenibacillus sp. MWE-103]|uniref:DNA repair exonuclease n=1 Tax=Paenibacillus artemisiicola TaxID=1172618 RepID=A0ABS3WBU8_9BACL|nr:DNA repair exonuclease [Paenibacillus artemisiicola]MBO7745585.1 DNA repair exonuclease [Paenibacillus artemisiicola]
MGVPFRFIHAADLHVDSPFRGLTDAPPEVREALRESTFRAARRLADAAIEEAADFVVIAGDLYDAADRSLHAQLALQKEWQRLHAHGVQLFIIHGNHDPLSGRQAMLRWPESARFFGAERAEQFPAYTRRGELAAYVTGISYASRSVTANLAARYEARRDGTYEIALLHGNVDGDASHDPYAPCRLDELTGAGFHYWALGHIHQRAVLHAYPHVVYAGNTQGRHARETGAKGCYVVDVAANRETKLRFVPLDTVRWANLDAPIDGLTSEQALLDAMERRALEAAAANEGRSLMARLKLTGRGPMHGLLGDAERLDELLAGLRDRMAESDYGTGAAGAEAGETPWCWIASLESAAGADADPAALAEEDSFAGELVRGSRRIERGEEPLEDVLEEALQPLLGHPKLRRAVREAMKGRGPDWLVRARELAAGLLAGETESPKPDTTAQGGKAR